MYSFVRQPKPGSTGEPKGVMLSHSAQLIQASKSRTQTAPTTAYVVPHHSENKPHAYIRKQALEKVGLGQYDASTVYLSLAPLFHIAGLNSSIAVTLAGGTHVFLQPPGGPRGKEGRKERREEGRKEGRREDL